MTLLPILLLLATPDAANRFETCVALTKSDPAKAVATADAWRNGGGGVPARQCLGLAYAAQERWAPAAVAFEQAARDAMLVRDGRAANLWVQAGNSALAGNDPARARSYFDSALALPTLSDAMSGEAHLDRARAQVALGNLPAGRADLDQAIRLVPGDPLAWLLSASLAVKQGDAARAKKDIAEAQRLAPEDADVKLEAERIAAVGK